MNHKQTLRLWCAAALLAPLLAAGATRFAASGLPGPSKAAAANPETPSPDSERLTPVILTPRQIAAADAARDPLFAGLLDSPFYRPPTVADRDDSLSAADADDDSSALPEVTLSSFMGGRNPMVVIDATPRFVGSTLPGGWEITAIDAAARTVEIRKGDRTATLRAR